ncbi:MAG TPA: hypothetical protein VI934_01900 [Candidatus Nanoarchaeia archaeon]|nr:hypothetical protein [Candidatus Nanoarchaeia archaeon]
MVKMEYVFFVLGVIFIFATVAYFSYKYVFGLADSVKAVILLLLSVVTFFIGVTLQERGI